MRTVKHIVIMVIRSFFVPHRESAPRGAARQARPRTTEKKGQIPIKISSIGSSSTVRTVMHIVIFSSFFCST